MVKTVEKPAYKTSSDGYNRISGRKTLVLVGICISLVIILSVTSFFLLFNSK